MAPVTDRHEERAEPSHDPPRARGPDPLSFTADDGLRLAALAGEALAAKRGNSLRPGWRPVHTRGVFLSGTFEPNRAAGPAALRHLAGVEPIPVVARLSSCDPALDQDDRRHGPRGLAVRFQLPGGETADLVAMSTNRFIASTRGGFIAVSRAMSSRLPMRLVRLAWLTAVRQLKGPWTFATAFSPQSYARCDYHAIHTFVWSTGHNRQPVRLRWRAVEGAPRPRPWTRLFKDRRYLARELCERMRHRSLQFCLEVQFAADVSPARLADPGRPLSRAIPWTPVGTLYLCRIMSRAEAAVYDQMVFSPTHLPLGIEPYPGDEIIAARAAAYPASHLSRVGSP